MGWLPTSILPREARFAHVASSFRLAEIYVPFVCRTDAHDSVRQVVEGGPVAHSLSAGPTSQAQKNLLFAMVAPLCLTAFAAALLWSVLKAP